MEFTATSKSGLIEDYIVKELIPKYRAGEKLPSELELSRELKTSRPTIHKILSNLTSLGLLQRKNGIGTFVNGPRLKSDTVMAVLPSPSEISPTLSSTWFNSQFILEGFEARASKAGIGVQIAYLHPDDRSSEETVDILMRSRAGSYLIPSLGGYEGIIRGLMSRGLPCVARSHCQVDFCHCVYGLLKEGAKEGVKALIDAGCRRIAHFSRERTESWSHYEKLRYSGYEEALKEAGLPVLPELDRVCGGFPHEGYLETRKMLAEGVVPDGIFGGTDIRSFGIIQALKEAGLRIPEDVSVVGSDNLPEGLAHAPALSTVDYPMKRMGETMFEMLQEALANPGAGPMARAMKCEFIRRGSIKENTGKAD